MPITKNDLPRIRAHARPAVADALARTAFAVHAFAAARAPVDTGNLRASGRAVQMDALAWRVVFTAEYAVYVELGTRKMTAQPYLVPALRAVFPAFIRALRLLG